MRIFNKRSMNSDLFVFQFVNMNVTVHNNVQSLFREIESKSRLHKNSDEKLQSFRVSVR